MTNTSRHDGSAVPVVEAPEVPASIAPPAERLQRRLADYDRSQWNPGRGFGWQALWYVTSLLIFENGWVPSSRFKKRVLRWFGARVGSGLVIKPHVRIKLPWRLELGENVWIGEGVWIDNLAMVSLSDNTCLSQGAYLCTGSHDFRSREFDLITQSILVLEGAWVGARAILLPGVRVGSHAVVAAGSIVSRDVDPECVVAGNPASVIETELRRPRQPR